MRSAPFAGSAGCLVLAIGLAAGSSAAEPAPGPPTIWRILGIPQAFKTIRDNTINRRGNSPKIERKPPLKKIADPANLESPNPVIKAAAKIKTEEDLAPQKIKAIKYLAEVGCGCYPDVRQALLASLDDCTEEVRYEAAIAFCEAAGNPCDNCPAGSCCNAEVMTKLQEMASGKDAKGCFKEPSSRVRAAARNALGACRRVLPPSTSGEKEKKEVPVESPETPSNLETAPLAYEHRPGDEDPLADQAATFEDSGEPSVFPSDGAISLAQGLFEQTAYQAEAAPSIQPLAPQPAPEPDSGEGEFARPSLEQLLRQVSLSAPAEATTSEESTRIAPSDLGGLLQQSSDVQSVKVQRRSPVALDPNVRGFKAGQVYTLADGAYWTPARRDLDTMLSKIDPGTIQEVVVLKGPYGLRYGPGFAFIDVIREPTPRYACGFESHFRTAGTVRTNGGQLYGRETVYGGCQDWGYRFSYGHRLGSDYRSGDGLHIPSSYHNRDVWAEFGYDLNPHQRIEFAYQRLDQTDTEYAGQFFDVDFLGTYGFQLRLIDEDPRGPWSKLAVEGWYNRTRFVGDTDGKRNPYFPVIDRIEYALNQERGGSHTLAGASNGAVASSGARAAVTFGEPDDAHVDVGADFRYLGQIIEEHFELTQQFPNVTPIYLRFDTNMPHAWLRDPGLYAEWSAPVIEDWTISLGGRVDYASSTARESDLRDNPTLRGGGLDLRQDDLLYAFYVMNELALNRCWTLRAGFGHAQRPPTLVERYSDGMFLGIVQSGFTRVVGDPNLNYERNWQIDVGLSADHQHWRGTASFFHAWVLDYITLEDDTVIDFGDARLLYFTNTDLATLTGFELAGEWDLSRRLSVFGTMRYVDGRDRAIHAPLPAISPLEGTVGLRLHDSGQDRRWGIECAARIVDNQDRLGTIRLLGQPSVLEEPTPGFTVWHLRTYYNSTENLRLIAGIENLFDKNYQEHLDLRLLGPTGFGLPPTRVLSPGFTPYFSVEWTF